MKQTFRLTIQPAASAVCLLMFAKITAQMNPNDGFEYFLSVTGRTSRDQDLEIHELRTSSGFEIMVMW